MRESKRTDEDGLAKRIEDAQETGDLELDGLTFNQLPPAILELSGLRTLYATGVGLHSVPEEIARLSQLETLSVANNQITALPDALGRLTELVTLDVSNNRLTSVPDSLGQLQTLRILWAYRNQILCVPEGISRLRNLRQLSLSSNQIESLPDSLFDLTNLESLCLAGNRLTDIPPSINRLARLRHLALGANPLERLPEGIGELRMLESLDLSGLQTVLFWPTDRQPFVVEHDVSGQLLELPRALQHIEGLRELYVHGQPLLGLPPELLGPTRSETDGIRGRSVNSRAILDYYFSSRVARRPLNEVRLLLVGRGGAGKTSLVRRLVENKFSKRQRETQGIDIRQWLMGSGRQSIRAHVWDFAGQVITHSTHQFFLSHRSVYVLVLTGREDSEKHDAEYWLRLVRAFGTERDSGETSPVIVALNKCKSSPCKIDRNALQEKYPFIAGFIETDCESGDGIQQLKRAIVGAVRALTSVREPFPESWFRIKEHLATLRRDHLSYAEFQAECSRLGEASPERQASLTRVLHALGVALNYSDDERLREATVLNPQWVTRGIYTLLRDGADGHGIMTLRSVEQALPNEPPEMRRYLVELMRRFDLAFPLSEDGQSWLVPQRLPPEQPKLSAEWQMNDITRLRYSYAALPEGLIPRFITRSYPLSEGQPRWMNGVILEMDSARALVRADPAEREVNVAVQGPVASRRRLVGLIREDLQRIHSDIRGLDPLEEKELNDHRGEWIRVEALEADERKGKPSAAATRTGTLAVDNTTELNRVSTPSARNPRLPKLRAFISYANEDARRHDQLAVRLKPLKSEGLLETWSDRCLVAGQEWDGVIRAELEQADLILLLWSPYFEASDYVRGVELARAVERAASGEAVLVSIILESCGWKRSEAAKYQVLPKKGKAVRGRSPQHLAWFEIAEELRVTLEKLQAQREIAAR